MNINLTLIAQSVAFFVFAFVCWRFIWPVVIAAMEERRKRIEQGLADAASAEQALADSRESVAAALAQARARADEIIRHARELSANIEQEGRDRGKQEAERAVREGQQEIERLLQGSRQELREQIAALVYEGVEKITSKDADRQLHDSLVEDLMRRL